MWRYRYDVSVWIIDNEPDAPFYDYYPTPAECVAFTRIAWEELHDLGIDDRCQIESPPTASVDTSYMTAMLDEGLAQYCHVVGVHVYGAQIIDSRIRKPWDRLTALGINNRAVAGSECGISPDWCPEGFPGGVGVWRANFHRQPRVQAKAHGYDYTMMFSIFSLLAAAQRGVSHRHLRRAWHQLHADRRDPVVSAEQEHVASLRHHDLGAAEQVGHGGVEEGGMGRRHRVDQTASADPDVVDEPAGLPAIRVGAVGQDPARRAAELHGDGN